MKKEELMDLLRNPAKYHQKKQAAQNPQGANQAKAPVTAEKRTQDTLLLGVGISVVALVLITLVIILSAQKRADNLTAALDPNQVKGLAVSNTEFNPNTGVTYVQLQEGQDRNVAVSDVIEPGSTFKTVALMAMLTDPELQIDTAASYSAWHKDFGGKGGAVQDDHAVRDSAGAIRQTLNVREIIEQSSNVGMADMGMVHYGDRRDRLRSRMLEIFPYEKLNPDVVAPQARTYIHEDMRPNSNFTRLCFGYSTRVSPLQIVTFYNALAAGGRMVKPQFCRGYMHGDRLVENKPVVLNPSICSRQQAQMMRTMP